MQACAEQRREPESLERRRGSHEDIPDGKPGHRPDGLDGGVGMFAIGGLGVRRTPAQASQGCLRLGYRYSSGPDDTR